MTLVRLGIPQPPPLGVAFDLAPSVLPAHLGVGQELRQFNRPHLGPEPLRPSEVRDAAFCRDPGTGESHQVAAGTYQSDELFDLRFNLRVHGDITISDCSLRVNRRSGCDAPLEAFQDSPPCRGSLEGPSYPFRKRRRQ